MNQLGLDFYEDQSATQQRPAQPRPDSATDDIKADILAALALTELPPNLSPTAGTLWLSHWPEVCDPAFLETVVSHFRGEPALLDSRSHAVIKAVFELVYEGRVIADRHYYGNVQPGSAGYRGWRLIFRRPEAVD